MSVSERKFGALPTGEEVKIYHLENKKGAYAEVLQYGAILVKICVPDKNGDLKGCLYKCKSVDTGNDLCSIFSKTV